VPDEQDPAPLRRDQPQEPAAGVDHRQAAFMAIHNSPCGALLIRYPAMMSSTPAFASAASRRSIETRPTSLSDSRPTTLGAPELAPCELLPDLADALVAPRHRDALGRVLRRDAQQSVRLGQSVDVSRAATIMSRIVWGELASPARAPRAVRGRQAAAQLFCPLEPFERALEVAQPLARVHPIEGRLDARLV
jgi:hypothetical protein